MKKPVVMLSILAVTAGFFSPAWAEEKPKLVASVLSDRYHLSICKVAKKIPKEEMIVFETPEQALEKLVPCKKCDPPTTSHNPRG